MPIYAYRCADCGFEQDVLQKLADAALTECPSCHAQALQKRVTAAGFTLKGSGWYATDFRNNKPVPAVVPAAKEGEASTPAKEGGASPAPSPNADSAPAASDSASPGESGSQSASGTSGAAACAPGCGCH